MPLMLFTTARPLGLPPAMVSYYIRGGERSKGGFGFGSLLVCRHPWLRTRRYQKPSACRLTEGAHSCFLYGQGRLLQERDFIRTGEAVRVLSFPGGQLPRQV